MVAIQTNQGIMPQFFFPNTLGRGYGETDYLKVLEKHRDQLTVFSGLSHPRGPVLADLKQWLNAQDVLPKSLIGKATTYTLNQWEALNR